MSVAPLKRRPLRGLDHLSFLGGLSVLRGRVHEFCGDARITAALALARSSEGPVIWIAPSFGAEALNPDGVRAFMDPGRLVFVNPDRSVDLLWAMEEVLRAGVVPLVIAQLPAPPALTPVRRLTLAAEAGSARSGQAPLGVILTPGDGGAAGIETRWHLSARHHGETKRWHLEQRRARLEAPRAWAVTIEDGHRVELENVPLEVD